MIDEDTFDEITDDIYKIAKRINLNGGKDQLRRVIGHLKECEREAHKRWRSKAAGIASTTVQAWARATYPNRLVGYSALDTKVLVATYIGGSYTDFATYLMVVPGLNHAREVVDLFPGSHKKLSYAHAVALAPFHVYDLEEQGLKWRP